MWEPRFHPCRERGSGERRCARQQFLTADLHYSFTSNDLAAAVGRRDGDAAIFAKVEGTSGCGSITKSDAMQCIPTQAGCGALIVTALPPASVFRSQ